MPLKPAFGFHPAFPRARMVRAFPFCSRPAPVCAILAGSVLTFCQKVNWELVAVRRPFDAFAAGGNKRRPAPPKQAREFPRPIFLPFPESLKYTAVSTGFRLSQRGSVEIQWGDLQQRPCQIVTQARNFLPRRKAFLPLPCFNDRTDRRKQEPNC